MATNVKAIKTTNIKDRYKALCIGFSVWALVLLFMGFVFISEAYHSAATDVLVLGLGAVCASLASVFHGKAQDA